MCYNDPNMQQPENSHKFAEEQYRYLQEHKQNEWRNLAAAAASVNNSNNLWSPAYRREGPTSNWSTPSPPLNVPPGFEQHFSQANSAQQQQQQHVQNNNPVQMPPAYDPFKSFSAIWEPNQRNDNGNRDTWNQ